MDKPVAVVRIIKRKRLQDINKKVRLFEKVGAKVLPDNYDIWLTFCEHTTIQGLKFIFRRKPLALPHQIIWIVIWLAMFGLASWLCMCSTLRYFHYGVKTHMYYEKADELTFPAITFCNQNLFKRSFVGSSDSLIEFNAIAETSGNDLESILQQIKKDAKLCTSNLQTKFSSMQVIDLIHYGTINTIHEISEGFENSVLKCWWDNKETTCDNLFVNHLTDFGYCFSFNPMKLLTYEGQIKKGVNHDDFIAKMATRPGPSSGARFLLNVDQKEYCGSGRSYTGAGFKFSIHDPVNKIPSFELFDSLSAISAAPGYEMTVSLRAVKFTRNTEHLGKCHSPQYIVNNTKIYYKTICFILCHSMLVFRNCHCFPNYIEGTEIFFATNLDVPLSAIHLCSEITQTLCMRNKYFLENLHFTCPFCTKDACIETRYDQTITLSYFPRPSLADNFSTESASNISETRKNYVMINVFFEDMNVLNVIESQEFTFANLIMYYGGYTVLFMGISFMSFWEIVFEISRLSDGLIRKIFVLIFKSKSKSKVHTIRHKYK